VISPQPLSRMAHRGTTDLAYVADESEFWHTTSGFGAIAAEIDGEQDSQVGPSLLWTVPSSCVPKTRHLAVHPAGNLPKPRRTEQITTCNQVESTFQAGLSCLAAMFGPITPAVATCEDWPNPFVGIRKVGWIVER